MVVPYNSLRHETVALARLCVLIFIFMLRLCVNKYRECSRTLVLNCVEKYEKVNMNGDCL
jgi:hypothetical protein